MSTNIERIQSLLLFFLAEDGSTVGNVSLEEQISNEHPLDISDEVFDATRNQFLDGALIGKGRGRDGVIFLNQSVALIDANGYESRVRQ